MKFLLTIGYITLISFGLALIVWASKKFDKLEELFWYFQFGIGALVIGALLLYVRLGL